MALVRLEAASLPEGVLDVADGLLQPAVAEWPSSGSTTTAFHPDPDDRPDGPPVLGGLPHPGADRLPRALLHRGDQALGGRAALGGAAALQLLVESLVDERLHQLAPRRK